MLSLNFAVSCAILWHFSSFFRQYTPSLLYCGELSDQEDVVRNDGCTPDRVCSDAAAAADDDDVDDYQFSCVHLSEYDDDDSFFSK